MSLTILGEPGLDPCKLCVRDRIKIVRESNGLLACLLEGVRIEGRLVLGHLSQMTAIPSGLRVERDLTIAHCPNLVEIGPGLHVGGHFYLDSCLRIPGLYHSAFIGGNLYLNKCAYPFECSEKVRVAGFVAHTDL